MLLSTGALLIIILYSDDDTNAICFFVKTKLIM
jgi:hypothetical protein